MKTRLSFLIKSTLLFFTVGQNLSVEIRRRLAAGVIAFASILAISTSRFEKDAQSCGMVNVQIGKKRQNFVELP